MGLMLRLVSHHRDAGDTHEDMEMRRRYRSFYPGDDHTEMRRRRYRSEDDSTWGDLDAEMRRRRYRNAGGDDWEDASREMGFDTRRNEMAEMRAEMHHLKEKVGELTGTGYASVKKLAPNLEGVLEDATKIIKNPPSTWPMYLQRKDYKGIAKMEGKELMAALESGKAAKDIRKELVHTIAALMLMVEE